MKPVVGYAGMTHLGLNSAAAAAERGFDVVCFDPDSGLIDELSDKKLPVVEPGLSEALAKNENSLSFTANVLDLSRCDVVYIAPDIATGDDGESDLSEMEALLDTIEPYAGDNTVLVILSQVPPGFTRSRMRPDRLLFYQVETLIFGEAFERALNPERFIVGCAEPAEELPTAYSAYLDSFGCSVLAMRYESAELAKVAINCFLVAQVSTANTLAELCESIGADWSEIAPALRLDKRIGEHAYLKPGLGIAGGNLERDLATVRRLAAREETDAGIVEAWVTNSAYRKNWVLRTLQTVVPGHDANTAIAVWGLTYKENTASTRNSPALALLEKLAGGNVTVYDPMVTPETAKISANGAISPLDATKGADVLLIMTPWPEFGDVAESSIADAMNGQTVIDPYGVLDGNAARGAGLNYYTLGVSHVRGHA